MTCVRRLAGARRPAPPAGSSSRPDPQTGRRRARLALLLPALALLLGALSLFAAVPAQAQVTVWSATLTTHDLGNSVSGCANAGQAGSDWYCTRTATLSDDDFVHDGATYTVRSIFTGSGDVTLRFTSTLPAQFVAGASLKAGTLTLALADATFNSSSGYTWSPATPVNWSVGSTVSLSLVLAQGTQSSNANLSALTATSSTSASGTFGTLGIGTFGAGTTSYTASVANSVTHVKLTPTVAESNASVKVGKAGSLATVTSGSASTAIALAEGANAIKVEVTAQDGTTKDYTVTVTRAAAAVSGTVWQATLNPKNLGGGSLGCSNSLATSAHQCSTTATLSEDEFSHGGTDYDVYDFTLTGSELKFGFVTNVPAFSGLSLCVGDTSLAFADATINTSLLAAIWSSTSLSWAVGTPVSLKIAASCAAGGTPPTQSSDASLTSLTGTTSTDGSTFGGTLGIGTFAAATTSYTANVATDVTHVKLTPTRTHSAATIKVGKAGSLSDVTSGSASGAIALGAAGSSTALKVEVTAEDGTKQTYTVTVARAAETVTTPPASPGGLVSNVGQTHVSNVGFDTRKTAQGFTTGSHAAGYNLTSIELRMGAAVNTPANLRVELWSASGSGTPNAKLKTLTVPGTVGAGAVVFAAPSGTVLSTGTTYFVVAYETADTTASVAATASDAEDAGAAPGWSIGDIYYIEQTMPAGTWRVNANARSAMIRVNGTPEATPPGAPTGLGVEPGNKTLAVTWTAPANDGGSPVTGYHVHYTSAPTTGAGAVADSAASPQGVVVTTGWVAIDRSGTTASQTISGLTDGTTYRVRVRAVNAKGSGAWVFGSATATPPPGRVVAMRVIADRITDWRGDKSGQLRVYWRPPDTGGAHDGYEVQYTTSDVVANDEAAGTSVGDGWMDAGGGKGCCWRSWSQHIYGLPADKQYRVRVRAVHSGRDTAGPWSYDRRSLGAMTLRAGFNPRYFGVAEGSSVTLTVELTHAAPAGGMKVQIAVTGVTGGTATLGADYRLNKAPAPAERTGVNFEIPAGQKTGTATLYILDDGEPEGDETIELRAHQRVQRVVPSSNVLTLVIGANDGHPSDTAMKILTMNADGNSPEDLIVLNPPFDASITSYRASVSNRVESVRFSASTSSPQARLTVNGGSGDAAVALKEGANRVDVKVTSADAQHQRTYTVTVNRAAAEETPEPPKEPLTAAFEAVPGEHDGRKGFDLLARFSEALGSGGKAPAAKSFAVKQGKVKAVERIEAGLWRVRIKPDSWKDIAVTLAGGRSCEAAGAVCAADGRALSNTAQASIGGPVRIRLKGGKAREGKDESLDFLVSLNRAASHAVSVDYATADGTATAGEDYTATGGTLVFAPGETEQTVSVAILDDAVDEGKEHFLLRLSNPQGAYLRNMHREAKGVIRNDDHLQTMWLSRFGRTVAGHVTDAVSGRLEGLAPGAHATLAGQPLDLSRADDGKALAEAMTGLARTFGAPGAPAANDDGPFARRGLGGLDETASASAAPRSMTGRELLLGSSFHLAMPGEGSGPGLAAWGRAAHGSFDGEHADGTGRTRVDGKVLTGTLGADAEWDRLLAGVAVSLSEGEGKFDSPGVDTGQSGDIESTMTTVSPYLRFKVTERVSAWGLAGFGTGDMTIGFDDGVMDPIRTDLSMQLGAVGARGELLTQDASGGMDLALKADAFFVRMDSEKAVNSVETTADASRVRLMLEGGQRFALSETATLRPSLELGVRHDGGDAETGTGVEVGGGIAWSDAASGLSIEAKARMLIAHADSDHEEWGASATARLDPGEHGRGLAFSLSPTIGTTSSAAERLWGAHDARTLAPGGTAFEAARGLTAEAGYGVALPGGFTGMPNLGYGMSDGGARDWRIGWRLTPNPGSAGFEVNLDAVRREAANDNDAEHGVMLRSLMRW